jgi:parallel beta-helix repeat protein
MSKSAAAMLVLAFLAASCITATLPVNAGSRTIVVPDDYPTINAAIDNATAGDTIFVKKGTYESPIDYTLVINKTLSLIGEDANNTILNLHPHYTEWWILTQLYISYSNAITVDASNFKISGFTINTSGGDISITGDRTELMSNNITTGTSASLAVSGSHCNITDNISSGFISLNGSLNVIARNSFANILLSGDSNTISNNTCRGITVRSSSLNVISGNKISTSELYGSGIMVAYNSSYNLFYANYISGFAASVAFNSAENNTFYHNNFVNNADEPVSIYVEPARNFWDNGREGNYWSDYNGTDANGDGVGDTPYVIDAGNVDRYPLMEPYDINTGRVVLPPSEPFPIIIVTAAVTITVIVIALLVYFKKRNR